MEMLEKLGGLASLGEFLKSAFSNNTDTDNAKNNDGSK